jgi:hypothetical protein
LTPPSFSGLDLPPSTSPHMRFPTGRTSRLILRLPPHSPSSPAASTPILLRWPRLPLPLLYWKLELNTLRPNSSNAATPPGVASTFITGRRGNSSGGGTGWSSWARDHHGIFGQRPNITWNLACRSILSVALIAFTCD